MIFVRSGWVRVVYEDHGEPFVMNAGDLVLQPPEIRHRVLESSPGLEVVEITSPSLHETFADHELELPNGRGDPSRNWAGQQFLRHVASKTPWTPFLSGEAQETAIHEATGGIAQVRTIRPGGKSSLSIPPHDGELVFGFVLEGTGTLDYGDRRQIGPADSFVVPPNEPWALADLSPDFRLLHVTTQRLD
jgi:mannose-6-phosphate isomerase-like protein (cupin superfamily)